MKKHILAALAALTLTACDQGSMFVTPTMVPDEVHRLEAAGVDLRIYEFTPASDSLVQCIVVVGDRKGGLDCFPKIVEQRP